MNFLDTFDVARPITPNPATAPPAEQPSLNEEVNQVIGQLGRFWGGFRKQSQTALEAARKDLSEVVVQAQKELSKLTTAEPSTKTNEAPEAPTEAEASSSTGSGEPPSSAIGDAAAASSSSSTSSLNTASTATPREGDDQTQPSSFASSSSALFARLQSALPPNIVATVQSSIDSIPESLKHASDSLDLPGLRTNLLSELQRVQGVTRAQAEEYAHKSEALLREAVKEAGDALREAVKVIPPDQGEGSAGYVAPAMMWDGTEMWLLPSDPSEASAFVGGAAKGLETSSAVATRAEALLRRLKRDPAILRHDPEVEEGVKEQYTTWKEKEVDALEGGLDGADWKAKVDAALEDPVDGQELKELETTLVPSEMTQSAFWLRYFFRVHQIRSEEEKRQALIRSSTENDEDFSWEDEDELSPTTGAGKSAAPIAPGKASADQAPMKENLAVPAAAELSSGTNSPRVSSEDSFDVVSSNVSAAGDLKPTPPTAAEDEDGDSDWE